MRFTRIPGDGNGQVFASNAGAAAMLHNNDGGAKYSS
jgi:hypothetical protein